MTKKKAEEIPDLLCEMLIISLMQFFPRIKKKNRRIVFSLHFGANV